MFMFIDNLLGGGLVVLIIIAAGVLTLIVRCYRKVEQGKAIVRNGLGGTKVSFCGIVVLPIVHKAEIMDISVKRVEIDRNGKNGLICMDNLRADIKVAFFVRVNQTPADVLKVAQAIGCARASSQEAMIELFDAKFSEALKTVGRQFAFVDLYNSREKLKEGILRIIGTDLNGFVLEDVAIDFLEQTPLQLLNPDNILDSEGIKKITELTAAQKVLANQIDREKEKTITKQNVQAQEAILELTRQLAEAEEKQKREVSAVKAREEAEAKKIQEEQRLKSEQTRIAVEEELFVAEENKNRQVIVARKNKERTEAIENERVEKDRLLEVTERERIVALATIEKNKVIEVEQKAIQDVIRERLVVEKAAVEERERIKDTEAFADAGRQKKVLVTRAEMEAEQGLIKNIKAAEAAKRAAELKAEQDMFISIKSAEAARDAAQLKAQELVIESEASQAAASKQALAKKALAEAHSAEVAAEGLAEAQVLEARALAFEKQGATEAKVMELKFQSEAKGIAEKAAAFEKQGTAEAKVLELKLQSEAKGITEKAEAMKLLDGVGREHEEFKLRLNKEKEIELAQIGIQKDIAQSQASVLGEALKSARIDIVGGETEFFDRIVGAITTGKTVDRMLNNSEALTDIKETFFNSDPDFFFTQLKTWVDKFGLTSEDLKNLTVAAALSQMMSLADDGKVKSVLTGLLSQAKRCGIAQTLVSSLAHDGRPVATKSN